MILLGGVFFVLDGVFPCAAQSKNKARSFDGYIPQKARLLEKIVFFAQKRLTYEITHSIITIQ